MPQEGFEPIIPVFEPEKTFHALDSAVTVDGLVTIMEQILTIKISITIFILFSGTVAPQLPSRGRGHSILEQFSGLRTNKDIETKNDCAGEGQQKFTALYFKICKKKKKKKKKRREQLFRNGFIYFRHYTVSYHSRSGPNF
jgi:hypothetical protein